MGESQNSHKWGHALMQLLETCHSEKDKEMPLVAKETFKKCFEFSHAGKNEEQKFTTENSSKESTVLTYDGVKQTHTRKA